jgi:hypothetical protein
MMTRPFSALLIGLALPAAAQTPLCQWNGASLDCPGRAPAVVPGMLDSVSQLDPLQRQREQRLMALQDQAAQDRAVALARADQAQARANLREQLRLQVATGRCGEAELLARQSAPDLLPDILTTCAGGR